MDPAGRAKRWAAATLLGEPGATVVRELLTELETIERERDALKTENARLLNEKVREFVEDQIAMKHRVEMAEAQLVAVRDATCPTCGRSLPPDGDCYGCQVDRGDAENDRMLQWGRGPETAETW
jgi:hypothetical protein